MGEIHIKGARVHNLKNIEVRIPHNTLTVVTGLSGSGKSTLAFDTIFAEGQRRYVESLSAYARQFLGRVTKPDVDLIEGIAPAIAIEQKVSTRNPRSTVGTTTEIYDYLKLLFARIGRTYSPLSGEEVRCHEVDEILEELSQTSEGTRLQILAPILLPKGRSLIEELTLKLSEGVLRLYDGSKTVLIEEFIPQAEGASIKGLYYVIDRLKWSPTDEEQISRLRDSLSRAYALSEGHCAMLIGEELHPFTRHFERDGITFERPTEHLFSFNNPLGACPLCEGYGKVTGIDEDLVVPDKSKSIYEDAIACWKGETMRRWKEALIASAAHFNFPIHTPWYELSESQRRLIWRGNAYFHGLDDFFQYIDKERHKIQFRVMKARYTGKTTCPECGGERLRKEALNVRIAGKRITEMVRMPVDELLEFLSGWQPDTYDLKRGERLLKEILTRLRYLSEVGLGYLTLDRLSSTLSGGESQRINLATSLGSSLVGSLYILDEPSIGLHPRDTERLIGVLKGLRDIGNTVIIVEHEEEVIRAADYLVEMGPEAGERGGEVLFSGSWEELMTSGKGYTADYLTGRMKLDLPDQRSRSNRKIRIVGARENNLKNITVEIPLGVICCITGVSGSGKSSLIRGVLYPALRRLLHDAGSKPGNFDRLEGDLSLLSGVEMVDQNPIGKSSRSNPVTYLKAYDEIRKLFAEQPYARHSGIQPSHFSFNMAGGRCEECQGEGIIKVGMQFMADVELICEACGGKRFKDEILEVRYRGKSIADILELSVEEAIAFFGEDQKSATCRRIVERLQPLADVGLGYIRLGQSSSTLSGGESQRVKLASFLSKDNDGRSSLLFIFDEPTTGLHLHDIRKLLQALRALVERGHSVLIVEHNPEVIRSADWVIDLGPEAGDQGGEVIFSGTPEELSQCPKSYTGRYLKLKERAR